MRDPTSSLPERRHGDRHMACFPASIERPDGAHRASLIRDLSESGVLLLVRTTKVAVGDQLRLQLFIAEDAKTHRPAVGHVVRVEDVLPQDAGPWLRRVAVQFDTPLTVYAEDIRAFQERAARLGIPEIPESTQS